MGLSGCIFLLGAALLGEVEGVLFHIQEINCTHQRTVL